MRDQLAFSFAAAAAPGAEDWVAHAGVAEATQRLATHGGGALALVGPAGAGKTHLGRLWAARVGAAPWRAEEDDPGDAPALVEDADRLAGDERLFNLFERAARSGRRLLFTGRTPPRGWPATVPDLRSRYNALEVLELGPPDEAGLAALLAMAFRTRQLRPPEELVGYLVRRIERSAAAAVAVVDRLDAAALAEGRPLTRAFAREVLGGQPDLFEDDEAPGG